MFLYTMQAIRCQQTSKPPLSDSMRRKLCLQIADTFLRGAAVAQLEEASGKVASKKGALADAGSFSLPAFIMPDGAVPVPLAPTDLPRPRPVDAAKIASLAIPPLLEPPAA